MGVNIMENIKKELVEMMNRALELEHAARIQYLSHAELLDGLNSEKLVERLKEIAGDEKEHEDKFRKMIGSYLYGVPSMKIAETHVANGAKNIFEVNLKGEKDAVDFYKQIYKKINEEKDKLKYEFTTLEHELRHIIIDEEEHIAEIRQLLELKE